MRHWLLAVLLLFICTSCSHEKVPDGRILVKNDSQDREYNVIVVSGKSLKPGEYTILPSGTTSFSVSRRYKDHTKAYSVRCPAVKGSGLYIKMIDIHLNRISGGCVTTQASR